MVVDRIRFWRMALTKGQLIFILEQPVQTLGRKPVRSVGIVLIVFLHISFDHSSVA